MIKRVKRIFESSIKEEYEKIRISHKKRMSEKNFLSIDKARGNSLKTDWQKAKIKKPESLGVKVLENYPLEKLREYIDWTPFFLTWELKGKYPVIFENEKYGAEAKKLFE